MASYENGCPYLSAVSTISVYTRFCMFWLIANSCKQKLSVVEEVSNPAKKNTNTFEILICLFIHYTIGYMLICLNQVGLFLDYKDEHLCNYYINIFIGTLFLSVLR